MTEKREHTAVALTAEGQEVLLYRGNLQRHQREATWDWDTVTMGTRCRCTIVAAERTSYRSRGIEILILAP